SVADWSALGAETGGALTPVTPPEFASADARALLSNPFFLGDHVGLTQISGFVDGWTSTPSAYAVRAHNAQHVAAALRFARTRKVRVVVKGGGHSYVGGSNGPDSLQIWTRALQSIELHDAYTPQGCTTPPAPAVSLGAGCIWGRVYDAVTVRAGRYVQGGG